MMLRLAAFLALACTGYGLDLTPRFVTRSTGSDSERIPYYSEGGSKYTIFLPPGTTASEEGAGTCFFFRQFEGASLILKASPHSPALAFSGTGQEIYTKEALQQIPQGAKEIEQQKRDASALSFASGENLGFTHSFKLPGRRFIQAVVFSNYSNEQQVMVILTAPADCFDTAASVSSRMLRSWRKVGKGEDLAAPSTL